MDIFDKNLKSKASAVIEERKKLGLDGLVGGLECVIINIEQDKQLDTVYELLRWTGLKFDSAFQESQYRTCVLKSPGSADFLIRSRLHKDNPFAETNKSIKSEHLPNTRLETFVFKTIDIEKYVAIQKPKGVAFLSSDIIHTDKYSFIQTQPSIYTGNSIGFIQWRDKPNDYITSESNILDWHQEKPNKPYLDNIKELDHAATRVKAQHRDSAIIEFMQLTNYNFQFAIYAETLNSITNVARLSPDDFAMVFTSGISPYINDEESGPTEKFIHNFGIRVHHIAFNTDSIEDTFSALKDDGMTFLIELVGSPEEGLKQTFSDPSVNTLLVNEYIHRYGDFDGFFTKSNVTLLTEATGKQ